MMDDTQEGLEAMPFWHCHVVGCHVLVEMNGLPAGAGSSRKGAVSAPLGGISERTLSQRGPRPA